MNFEIDNFKNTDDAFEHIFDNSKDDFELYKNIAKNKKSIIAKFGDEDLKNIFADIYICYEKSESSKLRCFLLGHYERQNGNEKLNGLIKNYTENNILVMRASLKEDDGLLRVIHQNPEAKTMGQYPVKVSRWIFDMGASGHSLYSSIEQAIRQEGMISDFELSELEMEKAEEHLINLESEFSAKRDSDREFTM